MNIKLVVTLVLIALAAIFIVQNAAVVDLRFLFWTITMSRALMFVFLVLMGIAIGWLWRGHMAHKDGPKENQDMAPKNPSTPERTD